MVTRSRWFKFLLLPLVVVTLECWVVGALGWASLDLLWVGMIMMTFIMIPVGMPLLGLTYALCLAFSWAFTRNRPAASAFPVWLRIVTLLPWCALAVAQLTWISTANERLERRLPGAAQAEVRDVSVSGYVTSVSFEWRFRFRVDAEAGRALAARNGLVPPKPDDWLPGRVFQSGRRSWRLAPGTPYDFYAKRIPRSSGSNSDAILALSRSPDQPSFFYYGGG